MSSTATTTDLIAGYGALEVFGPINLTLQPGITALLGRNGSGKTTLMRTLCGIIPSLGGTCEVLGTEVSDGALVRSKIGYLGHESALASALTVEQNLRFWRRVTGTYPEVTQLTNEELIAGFDLGALLDRKVSSLSRGQRQRADLARLAMTDPTFIVLDEPLTGLDPVYAAQIRDLISVWGTTRTVVYSTHSIPEALHLAQRFLVIHGRNVVDLDVSKPGVVTEDLILDVLEGKL